VVGAAPAGSPTVERVLRLQRTAGNAAVGRLLRAVINDIEVPAAVNHTHGGVLQDDHALRHERHKGVAFVRDRGEDASGVDPSDIRQGFIGDCFFLSPLMATARINPRRIANMVRGPIGESPSGGDTYEVKLYDNDGHLVTHHVDDRFVSNADGTPRYAQYGDLSAKGPELWVMLMEKAWAAQRGGFNNMDFGMANDGLKAVTGKDSTWHHIAAESADTILNTIWQAVQDGKPVIPITPGPITTPALTWAATNGITLIPSHAYNVESANRSDREIDVANPHGRNHLRSLGIGNFRMIFDWYLVGNESMK
jgi:hypothetical protein